MNFPNLRNCKEFALDTETTGLNPMGGDRVFGFSISADSQDYYYDVRENPQSLIWLSDQLNEYKGDIIFHNLSFDYRMLKMSGVDFDIKKGIDTCINACLINEHEHSYALDNLSKKYTNSYKKGDDLYRALADLFGGRATKNVQMKNISNAPAHIVAPYAKGDTRATLELHQFQKNQIAHQKLEKIVNFERSVTPHLVEAELHGIRVDIPEAEKAVGKVSEVITELQKRLNSEVGFAVNVNSQAHMKQIFKPKWNNGRWWACDGTPLEETSGGAASLGADAFRGMSHPAAEMILELRSMVKTRDTFLVGHVLESSQNGRVYPTINQNKGDSGGTGTGRLSYTSPALQQIPDRNKVVAEIVKKVFLPDEGHVWVDADMASFEVRIFAHLVGTPDICQAYIDDPETDFHQYVADETGLVRNATYGGQPNAKQLNLSMIFNQGDGTTAEKMQMPWTWESFVPKNSTTGEEVVYKKAGPEAAAIISKYHSKLPGVKKLAEGCKKVATERGYIFTRYGRHLRFPKGYKSYKASGLLIQSTSADENKMNWVLINQALEGTGAKLLLNTHDSYSLSIPKGQEKEIAAKVKKFVEADRGLNVPLILEVNEPGQNWWDSKQSKRWM